MATRKKEQKPISKFQKYTSTQNLATIGAMIGLFATGGVGGLAIGCLVGGTVKPAFNTISSTCTRKKG